MGTSLVSATHCSWLFFKYHVSSMNNSWYREIQTQLEKSNINTLWKEFKPTRSELFQCKISADVAPEPCQAAHGPLKSPVDDLLLPHSEILHQCIALNSTQHQCIASLDSIFLTNTCKYLNLYRPHCPTQLYPALPCWSTVPGSENLSSLSSHRGENPKLQLWMSFSSWRSVHDSFHFTLAAQYFFKRDFSLGEMSSTTSAAWNLPAF